MRHLQKLVAAAVLTAGCVPVVLPGSDAVTTTELIRSDDVVVGTLHIYGEPKGLRIHIEAAGLPQGIHGVHVHAVGRCDSHDFSTAGPHWNPAGRQHGHDNPAGFHLGDLGNVTVGADGRLVTDLTLTGASLAGINVPGLQTIGDVDGSALVIHAAADDERTDPSGNSGDRIACAVIAAPAAQP